MFEKLLIANRGEIALRIIRACREMGITAVAVYSEADRNSLHVRHADEAYLIGPAPARESYLNGERIIEVARKAGADALHPGYGFLAENADFAEACLDADLAWVGPSPRSIRMRGDKVEAEAIREVFGDTVPVSSLKGYIGHTLGASGALELIVSLAMMEKGMIYGTLNLENVAEDCQGIQHVMRSAARDIRIIMKSCFAFGGINAALVCRYLES